MDILAIIPARGGSKSIPQKNLATLAGKPLIAYSIQAALDSKLVSRVIISTDDPAIASKGREHGAEVPFMRPAELAADDTPDWPVFAHALEWLAANENYTPRAVVQLRPTSPLRRVHYIDEAVELLLNDPEADSVRSIGPPCLTPYKMWRIEKGNPYLKPLLSADIPEPYNAPRQKLPQVWAQNGLVEVTRPATILQKKSMTGDKIIPYVMDIPMVDIDDALDLKWAEIMMEHGCY
ncbi:acylneuraminate cytidylyltransferase family protein [Patescibacteria group bacterium]|nr:acylneuraminate cytidylyltransferase family protein [Patescibacteria group bacterium]MBU1449187.1 acylneuraminate cytidylyltransferase family protein [Patescibacteria group bacterium]